MSMDKTTGSLINKMSVLYLAPIWSNSFDGHLILLSQLPQLNDPNVMVSTYAVTDFEGNTKETETKPAFEIWSLYFLLPSIVVVLLTLFLTFKKGK